MSAESTSHPYSNVHISRLPITLSLGFGGEFNNGDETSSLTVVYALTHREAHLYTRQIDFESINDACEQNLLLRSIKVITPFDNLIMDISIRIGIYFCLEIVVGKGRAIFFSSLFLFFFGILILFIISALRS